MGDLFMVSWNT